MRKVKWQRRELSKERKWVTVARGEAIFHRFGVDYEEFESGPGNFTTAIIELPDGRIRNVPVEEITFLDKVEEISLKEDTE